jgi:hypothetical protein
MKQYISILFFSLIACNALFAQQDILNSSQQNIETILGFENQMLKIEKQLRHSEKPEDKHVLARIYFHFHFYDKTESILEHLLINDSLFDNEKEMLALLYYNKGKLSESLDLYKTVYSHNKKAYQAKHYISKISNDINVFIEYSSIIQQEDNGNATADVDPNSGVENVNLRMDDIEKYIFFSSSSENSIKKFDISEINDLTADLKELIVSDTIPFFKDAPAGVIDLNTKYTVTENNKSIYSEHKIIKILNDNGRDTYSDIQFGYDGSFQSIEIEKIRVFSKGVVYEIPNNNLRIITPWSGSYSNYKIALINLPNIELNSVIEYKYKLITHHSLHPNDFEFSVDVQDEIPIINQKQEVVYSKNKTLNFKYPELYVPDFKEDSANITYTWNVKNSEALVIEDNSKLNKYLPIIKGAFFTSWDEVYTWLKPYYLGENLELSDELKLFLKVLTKDTNDDLEKVSLVYNWINENIRYIAIEIGQGGVYPRNVNKIYNNRYGDCKDQATLLVSCLRELGIKSFPVLLNTSPRYDMDTTIQSLEFTHCIAYVEVNDKEFFCDVIAKQTPFSYLHPSDQNRFCFIIKDDTYQIVKTPVSDALENLEFKKMKVKMFKNGELFIEKSNQFNGESNTAYKNYFTGMNNNDISENIQYDISYFCPGGSLESFNIENINAIDKPIVINESFKVPIWPVHINEDLYSFKIPTVYFSFDELDQTDRKYDLHYETAKCKKYDIEIELPENYQLNKLPKDLVIKTNAINFTYKYSKRNEKLVVAIEYIRNSTAINVNEYKDYKRHHDAILNKLQEPVILKKVK